VLANSLNGLGIGLVGPLIAYWFAIKFQRGLIDIGPGIALGFIASAAGSFLAGRIARRYGIMKTVLWMRGVGIALLVAMPLVPWFWAAMGLYIVRGAGNRGTGGVRQALAAGLTRVERRGLASSLQNISIQLPRAIGPVIGGLLFHGLPHIAVPARRRAATRLSGAVRALLRFARGGAGPRSVVGYNGGMPFRSTPCKDSR
jgi:MFS family permease